MKHTICTAAGRITIEPRNVLGRNVVAVRFSDVAGLMGILWPAVFIEPLQAALVSQALDLAAEECGAVQHQEADIAAALEAALANHATAQERAAAAGIAP